MAQVRVYQQTSQLACPTPLCSVHGDDGNRKRMLDILKDHKTKGVYSQRTVQPIATAILQQFTVHDAIETLEAIPENTIAKTLLQAVRTSLQFTCEFII